MKEMARYKNELNTVPMRQWNSEEMDFFFSVLAKAKDQGTKTLEFTKTEIQEVVKTTRHAERTRKTLKQLANHVSGLKYIKDTEDEYEVMNLFQTFKVKWIGNDYTITVKIHENFEYILNKLEDNFTRFPIDEFVGLRSTYSKTLYRQLKQYTGGERYFSMEEFRERLSIPSSYRQTNIDQKVLKPFIEECSSIFKGLKVEKVHAMRKGSPVIGYRFTWKPENVQKWIEPEQYKQKKKKEQAEKRKNQTNLPEWYTVIPNEPVTEEDLAEVRKLQETILGKSGS